MDTGVKVTPHKHNETLQEKLLLEELNKFLEENKSITDEILNSMSHELRTPIVAIKAYTDMLLENKFGELTPEQKQRIELIKKNTNFLTKTIFEMLEKKP